MQSLPGLDFCHIGGSVRLSRASRAVGNPGYGPPRQRRGRILCIASARVNFRFCRAWRVRGFADDQVVVIGHAVNPHRPGTVAREPHGGLIPTLRPAEPGPGAGAAP